MAADRDAEIWGVMAASGSGKGVWINAQLRALKPRRLVIWDFKNEYQEHTGEKPGAKCDRTLAEVRAAMIAAGSTGPLRIRYRPRTFDDKGMRREFETLCSLVQAWESCTFLAEELSNVTMPGWAPPAWRMMSTGGRHEGIHIIGVSQNPASIDKQFLSNCTLIHVGQLHEHAHRQAVERSMDLMPGELANLVQFQWVEKHRKTGEFTAGVVTVPGKPAPAIPSLPRRRGSGLVDPGQAAAPAPKVGPSSTPKRKGHKVKP